MKGEKNMGRKKKKKAKEYAVEKPDFLTAPEVAKICGVTRNTVYLWVRKDKLSAYTTPGKTNFIRPSELVGFMQKHGMYVPPSLQDRARKDETATGLAINEPSVLIVDDDQMVRGMMVQVLNNLYPICQAQTGFEALHLATLRKDVKVVLLDIRMPGQDGLETYRELRKLRPDIQVIIVTGYIEDVPGEMMADDNIAGVIEKPADEETLIDQVDRAMAAASSSI